MSPCVCKIGFVHCALGDAGLCFRYSLFPNTQAGRTAAAKVGGRVRDADTYLNQLRVIRRLVQEREEAKAA